MTENKKQPRLAVERPRPEPNVAAMPIRHTPDNMSLVMPPVGADKAPGANSSFGLTEFAVNVLEYAGIQTPAKNRLAIDMAARQALLNPHAVNFLTAVSQINREADARRKINGVATLMAVMGALLERDHPVPSRALMGLTTIAFEGMALNYRDAQKARMLLAALRTDSQRQLERVQAEKAVVQRERDRAAGEVAVLKATAAGHQVANGQLQSRVASLEAKLAKAERALRRDATAASSAVPAKGQGVQPVLTAPTPAFLPLVQPQREAMAFPASWSDFLARFDDESRLTSRLYLTPKARREIEAQNGQTKGLVRVAFGALAIMAEHHPVWSAPAAHKRKLRSYNENLRALHLSDESCARSARAFSDNYTANVDGATFPIHRHLKNNGRNGAVFRLYYAPDLWKSPQHPQGRLVIHGLPVHMPTVMKP